MAAKKGGGGGYRLTHCSCHCHFKHDMSKDAPHLASSGYEEQSQRNSAAHGRHYTSRSLLRAAMTQACTVPSKLNWLGRPPCQRR